MGRGSTRTGYTTTIESSEDAEDARVQLAKPFGVKTMGRLAEEIESHCAFTRSERKTSRLP
jgi:hypothetical protein